MRWIQWWAIAAIASSIAIGANAASLTKPHLTPPNVPQLLAESRYDAQLLELTNTERRKAGLPPLRFSPQLGQAAQLHAEDMARNNFNSHTGSDGSSVGDRAQRTNYQFSYIGENIHFASPDSSPASAVRSWMKSPGHRANILSPDFTEIGFGYSYDGRMHRFVQVFGTPAGGSSRDRLTPSPQNPVSSRSTKTWNIPTIRGVPIDATVWENDANPQSEQSAVQEGANLFCQSQGYDYASSWTVGKGETITVERGTYRFNRGNPKNPTYCNWCRWHLSSVGCSSASQSNPARQQPIQQSPTYTPPSSSGTELLW